MARVEQRGENRGPEARRLFTLKEIVYIISIFLGIGGTQAGVSYFTTPEITQIKQSVNEINTKLSPIMRDYPVVMKHVNDSDVHMPLIKKEEHFVTRREYEEFLKSIGRLEKAIDRLSDKIDKVQGKN